MGHPDPVQVGLVRGHVKASRGDVGGWYWTFRIAGQHVGSMRGTRTEAQRRAAELDRANLTTSLPPGAKITIGMVIKSWLKHYIERSDLTHHTLKNARACSNHLLDHLEGWQTDNIEGASDAYRDARLKEGAASSTILNEWAILGQAWKHERKMKLVTGDLPRLLITKRRVYNRYTPTDDEIGRVVVALHERAAERVGGATWCGVALEIAWYTGARIAEIQSLTWERVDLDGARVTLAGKRSGRDSHREARWRTVPIAAELVTTLRTWREAWGPTGPAPGDFVVGSTGEPRSHGRELLKEVAIACGVPPFTWHGVRRRMTRRMRKAQIPAVEAAAYMGHTAATAARAYDEIEAGDLDHIAQHGVPGRQIDLTVSCGCTPGRKISVAVGVFDLGPIVCGLCKRLFEVAP